MQLVITLGCIRILCEISQNSRPFQLFRNIYQVIILHPCDTKITVVLSHFSVSISRWGASHNILSWWADCNACSPPAAEIYKWKLQGITCIIPSEKGSLEGTARAVDLKWVEPRRLSIDRNCRNSRRRYRGRYRRLCSSSKTGTPTPHYEISPWSRWGWAWNCGCSQPNTNIWCAFIDHCSRRDQEML